ncbi:ATP-binding domain-containing protein [Streptomyces sp. NPDC093225]|uniref:ATP-binding domain-containing protein n=1 Tax=Streptomyces sp. NPDC093225 TaxID=3366034 RepID=UPI003821C931
MSTDPATPTAPDAPEPTGDPAEAAVPAEETGVSVEETGVSVEETAVPAEETGSPEAPPAAGAGAGAEVEADAGAEADAGSGSGSDAGDAAPVGEAAAQQRSEAEAELAAQKVERERIERRKAERTAPVDAGTKLTGTAADLMAAVRAVESGAKSASAFGPPPAPRRPATPAPAPRRPETPAPTAGPAPVAAEAVAAVREVLARGGAPEALAGPAAEELGEGAADALRQDPWQLLAVPGVRPSQADGFARALLGPECGPGDERRALALVGWLLAQAGLKGHTTLEQPVLAKALAQYSVPDPDAAVEAAVAEGAVLVFQEPLGEPAAEDEEAPVRILLGLEGPALAEESLADGLARLVSTFGKGAGDTTVPEDWQAAAQAAPGPSAAELVRAAAAHGLVAHTGGEAARAEPAALVTAARALGLRAYAAAHTPAGRDRLAADLGPDAAAAAVTVAGLLAGAEGPARDADGLWELDLLAVLDTPQLDVDTAAALVESVPDGARLVLGGDPGVLGAAGPGRVFGDLLAARVCPQVASRTPDPGPLGELVSGIGIGELTQVDAPGKEVVIVPVRDAGEAVHRTVQLVADSVPRAFGMTADQVQVITPGHGGAAGTRALNSALKERLNPGPGRFGGFDPGDRVVHVPAAGRAVPGRVVSADAAGLHLDCAGTPVVVPKERVESAVRHGWAVTGHQAVGDRWPAVVVVLPGDAADALSRDWVYTAFGRAERHLSVVHGVDQALPRAVAEVLPKPRTTRLAALLTGLVAAASAADPGQ